MDPISRERRRQQILDQLELEFPNKPEEWRKTLAAQQIAHETEEKPSLVQRLKDWWDDRSDTLGDVAVVCFATCIVLFMLGLLFSLAG